MAYDIEKSNNEWHAELSPEEYRVLRCAADEAAFTGEYTDTKENGVYSCRACGADLFTSEEKFDSRCGWPAFYDPKDLGSVQVQRGGSSYPVVRCARCGSYLGELFEGRGSQPQRTSDTASTAYPCG